MIDLNKIKKMLQAQCEAEAVLSLNDTTREAVEEKTALLFDVFVEKCRKEGRALLQAKQFELAMTQKGNGQMLIHLGKQYLSQKADGQQLSLEFGGEKANEVKLTIVHGTQNNSN